MTGDRPAVNPPAKGDKYPDPALFRRGFGVSGVVVSLLISFHGWLGRRIDARLRRMQKTVALPIKPEALERFDLFSRCNDRYAREASPPIPAGQTRTYRPEKAPKAMSLEAYAAQSQARTREASYSASRAAVFVSDAEDEVLDQ